MSALLALLLTLAPARAATPDALEAAWQKELAYLAAEREALVSREAEVARESATRARAAEAELERRQARLLSLTREADAAEQLLSEAEREAGAVSERAEILAATVSQASETLGVEIARDPESGAMTDPAAAVQAVLLAAAAEVAEGGALRREEGSFFLPDGSAAQGTIVRAGSVAAWGVSGAGSGALVPAGEGRLQIRADSGARTATALAAGQPPATVELFLYESADRRVEERAERGFSELMEAGGIIGQIITVLGFVALILAIVRAGLLWRAGRGAGSLPDEVAALMRRGRRGEALALCRPNTAAGRVLRAVVEHFDRDREAVEDIASEALLRETPALDRFGTAIMVAAAVAPLLGLLGTVTGMIATFEIITEYGTGDPKLLSGGISEALVTTQLGLMVAIPGVLIGNLLNTRAGAVLAVLERGALGLINAHGAPPAAAPAPKTEAVCQDDISLKQAVHA